MIPLFNPLSDVLAITGLSEDKVPCWIKVLLSPISMVDMSLLIIGCDLMNSRMVVCSMLLRVGPSVVMNCTGALILLN